MKYFRILTFVAALSFFGSMAAGGNWPQWRGPHLNGSSDETNLPDKLDKEQTMLWSMEMPGPGAGTPIVWEDRIFVNALDKETKKLVALCVDRASGNLLWRKDVAEGFHTTRNSDFTSPSAITDGKTVFFYFGTGDLAAFDMDGNPKWARNISADHGAFNVLWLYGSSPLLYKGKLYVQVIHRDLPVSNWGDPRPGDSLADSYLLAVDPATGKDIWKQIRPSNAKAESKESYGTPIPFEGRRRAEILVVGGDCVTAHDPETGAELWRGGGWNPGFVTHWRVVPSAVVANDLAIVCTPKQGPVIAFRPGGSGDVTNTHIAWQTREITSDVPVPLYYRGDLYVLDGDFRTKGLARLDPKTGEVKWHTPVQSRAVLRASPTGADGKIYFMSEGADVWVVSAEDGKILYQGNLGTESRARATIVAAQGQLFVRTGNVLYAFGNK